ncbi:zinc finger protein CONSTANS-like [Impatiens glandulifera]|uniref:zinc finger protein CONSTANS-like n=1 Tax=Impatiens glandulifera TaxID=253017 RepID=UPI001FB181D0|nr:zinc finger protein CONSTANS-like [Impatiens glandulifera]
MRARRIMYGHNIDEFPASATFPGYNFPVHDMSTVMPTTMEMSTTSLPLNIPTSIGEFDSSLSSASSWQLMQNNGGMNNTGCSSSSYGSPTSCCDLQQTTFMQRSVSSLSLHKTHGRAPPPPPHFIWSNLNAAVDFLDSSSSDGTIPVRRACSTGDLQGINMLQHYRRSESPSMSNEESCSSIIEGMSKACRYSPEEKRERIDKYRSKRNQRNFNKTIKYACRKTLADSRPRIRGRFARNDEQIEKVAANPEEWNHPQQAGNNEDQEAEDYEEENWTNFLEAFSANLIP